MPSTETTTSTLSHPHADADVAYEYVRFAECEDAYFFDDDGEGYERPIPKVDSARSLKTNVEEVSDENGDTATMRRERWLYCFRLETTERDGEDGRAAYAKEYFVNEGGKYQRVVGSGPDRTVSDTEREAIKLKVKGVYDPEPEHFFWLSDIQLSAQRIEQLREDLQSDPILRGDLSRRENMRRYIEPVTLQRLEYPYVVRPDHETVPEGSGKARYVVNLVHPLSIAERLHATFQNAFESYLAWMGRAAPIRQMTDLTLELARQNDGVKSELRTSGDITEALEWKVNYMQRQHAIWVDGNGAETEAGQATLVRLVWCLKSPALVANLIDHASGSREHQAFGVERFKHIIAGLQATDTGQEYLTELYKASQVGTAVLDYETSIEDDDSRDQTRAKQRDRLKAVMQVARDALGDLNAESTPTTDTFNALNQVWGDGDKVRKAFSDLLEHLAVPIEKAHPIMSQEATLALVSVTTSDVVGAQRVPVVEQMPNGLPYVRGDVFEIKPIRKAELEEVTQMQYHVYEIQEAPGNAASQVTDSKIFQNVKGTFAVVNVVLAGAALRNWKEKPLTTSGGVVAAVTDLVVFSLDRKVQAAVRRFQRHVTTTYVSKTHGVVTRQGTSVVTRGVRLGTRRLLVGLSLVGLVVETVLGAKAVGEEMGQGDIDGAIAHAVVSAGGMTLAVGGMASAQASVAAATGTTVTGFAASASVLLGVGFAALVAGLILVYMFDDDDLELWAQDSLWGERFENKADQQAVQALVGPQALEADVSSALTEAIAEQMQALQRLFFTFEATIDHTDMVYGDAWINLDTRDDISMMVVTIERAMPGVPLPTGSRFQVNVEETRTGRGTVNVPDVRVNIRDEVLARLGTDHESGVRSAEPQKLLAAQRPPEEGEEDVDVRTAGELFLRLYDVGDFHRLMDKEGHYRPYPVGRAVPHLHATLRQSRPSCTVTFQLSEEPGCLSISDTAS